MIFDGIVITPGSIKNYITQQHIMRYVFASNYVKGKIVLDVACGSGYGSNYLARKGAKKVFGVDLDNKPLEIAKKFYFLPNVEFLQGNVLELPFPDEFFDVVISFETIEHLYETDKYIAEIKRVLKKDGIFICSTPNIKYTQHPPFHVHEFYPEEFYSLLENNFSKVEKYAQYITYTQRLNDIFRPKARIYKLISNVLNSIPGGKKIKQIIKKSPKHISKESKNDIGINPIKIEKSLIPMMESNKVVPLNSKKGILRIMVALCKYKKI